MSKKTSDPDISSLVDQLKDTTLVNNHIQKEENELVAAENIEQFVIKNSSDLINQSLDVMNNVKDYIMASGDPDSISALSELIRASSGAIESLNKIVIQNKRSATTMATKQMDIAGKYAIEEIFNKMLAEAKVIEADETDTNLSDDQEK